LVSEPKVDGSKSAGGKIASTVAVEADGSASAVLEFVKADLHVISEIFAMTNRPLGVAAGSMTGFMPFLCRWPRRSLLRYPLSTMAALP
jgi:hypothetical protein